MQRTISPHSHVQTSQTHQQVLRAVELLRAEHGELLAVDCTPSSGWRLLTPSKLSNHRRYEVECVVAYRTYSRNAYLHTYYVYISSHIHIHMHMNMHMHVRRHIPLHIHMHIHIHIQLHM